MKRRVTIAEAVDVLAEIEHRRLSQQAIRNCCRTHGVEIGNDHKVNTAALLKARAAGKELDKASGSGELAAARLRKVNLECRRLEVEVEKIEKKEERQRCRNIQTWLDRICSTARGRIDAAEQHALAKYPQHRAMITDFYNAVLKTIVDVMNENESSFPEPD